MAESKEFVQLEEDVSWSPLYNEYLAPTSVAQRTWSTYHIAALWIGMSVVISTYQLAAGLISQGMLWWEAMLTILLGNVIVLIPMTLNAHAGTRYGVSFPVLCRASFGVRGAHVPSLLRSLVGCGWFGIQTWIGGEALDALLAVLWPGWTSISIHTGVAFTAFWVLQVLIIMRGMEGIKLLEGWASPLLLLGGVLLLVWAFRAAGGVGPVLLGAERLETAGSQGSFWRIFWPGLTANVGYWATLSLNIPDFTRYARSQKSQVLGQALGLIPTMFAFAFIGVAVTSATVVIYGEAVWDPVALVGRFHSSWVVIFSMLVIMAAQITTNMAANVVAPASGFSNLNPQTISFMTGGLVTAAIGILMLPWKLMESAGSYIFTWLVGYSALMGAIAGVLICDYWWLRKGRLLLADLFKPDGVYRYSNGINWCAIAALIVAIAPVFPGFVRAALTPGGVPSEFTWWDQIYTYAWFVTFALAFAGYWLGMSFSRFAPTRSPAAVPYE
ncbi:MAG: NCS1 family nucleobase:cation symporter-1 [Acidobacteria bacterium]|nr:NCS1 family nucleobase:cation symporter-1 [Acidobacteriota bacterium]